MLLPPSRLPWCSGRAAPLGMRGRWPQQSMGCTASPAMPPATALLISGSSRILRCRQTGMAAGVAAVLSTGATPGKRRLRRHCLPPCPGAGAPCRETHPPITTCLLQGCHSSGRARIGREPPTPSLHARQACAGGCSAHLERLEHHRGSHSATRGPAEQAWRGLPPLRRRRRLAVQLP